MFNFFRKKDDYGYNEFQILYYTLKWRLKVLIDQNSYALVALNKAVSTYNRPLIKEKIQIKHTVEQQLDYMKQAIELASYILTNYQCLFENPDIMVRQKYIELCTYRLAICVPQLDDFWTKHTIKAPIFIDTVPKEIVELTDDELESEANKYVDPKFGSDK